MSSSSAVPQCRPHVSMLSKLIATQSMDTRLWLQGEMVRLVDPMIDSIFLRLIISSSVRPIAQKSKEANFRSTMSELCQLIEGEKETTNRLVRGQMDRLVNSLFLRLTNKALVNTEVSEFASVQPSPSNHQTVSSPSSMAQSTMNNSNEVQITCPPTPPTHPITTSQLIKQEYLEGSLISIPVNVDCSDSPIDADNHDQCDELDPVPFGTHLSSPLGIVQFANDNEREEDRFDEVDETDEDEECYENRSGEGELLTNGQIDENEMDANECEGESFDNNLTEIEQMNDDGDKDTEVEMDANNTIGEESTNESTTNPIQPNLAQSNSYLQCSHCPKSFYHLSKLQRHLRVHSCERPFQCDKCDKRFRRHDHLTTHQLIHQNTKRFQCHECDKRFTLKCAFDSHLRTHSGERPFSCRHCEKSFRDLSARNKHEQAIHLHLKPYRCKQCGHTATQRSNIIDHIRMVHFGLPHSIKQQRALNIIDERDPRELVEKV